MVNERDNFKIYVNINLLRFNLYMYTKPTTKFKLGMIKLI